MGFIREHLGKIRGTSRESAFEGPPLVFVHIPKCGGSAVAKAVQKSLGLKSPMVDEELVRSALRVSMPDYIPGGMKNLCREWYPQSVALLGYHAARREQFVRAHLPVSRRLLETFDSTHVFMTLLRDPVERWISNFRFDKIRNTDPNRIPWRDNKLPIRDEIKEAMRTRRGIELGRIYTWMLGGIEANGDIASSDATALAKNNLSRFALLALSEDWSSLAAPFRELFGRDLNTRTFKNSTAAIERRMNINYNVFEAIDEELRSELVELCSQDIDIYRYAEERLASH